MMTRDNNQIDNKIVIIRDALDFFLQIERKEALNLRDSLDSYINGTPSEEQVSQISRVLSEITDSGDIKNAGKPESSSPDGCEAVSGEPYPETSLQTNVESSQFVRDSRMSDSIAHAGSDPAVQKNPVNIEKQDEESPEDQKVTGLHADLAGKNTAHFKDSELCSSLKNQSEHDASSNPSNGEFRENADSEAPGCRKDMETDIRTPCAGSGSGRKSGNSAEFNLEFLTGKMLSGIFAAVLLTIGFILTAKTVDFSFGPFSKFISMLLSSAGMIIWGCWNAGAASSRKSTAKAVFTGTGYTLLYVTICLGCFYFRFIPENFWIAFIIAWSGLLTVTAASRPHIMSLTAQIGIVLSMPISISSAGLSCLGALSAAFFAQLPLQITAYRKSDDKIALYNCAGMILLLMQFLTINSDRIISLPEIAAGVCFGASTLAAAAFCTKKSSSSDWLVKSAPYMLTGINAFLVIEMLGMSCIGNGIIQTVTGSLGILFTDMAEPATALSRTETGQFELLSIRGFLCSTAAASFYALLLWIEDRKNNAADLLRPVSLSFLAALVLASSGIGGIAVILDSFSTGIFPASSEFLSALSRNPFIPVMPLTVLIHYITAQIKKSENDRRLADALAVFFSFSLCFLPLLGTSSAFALVYPATCAAVLSAVLTGSLKKFNSAANSGFIRLVGFLIPSAAIITAAGNAGTNTLTGGMMLFTMCGSILLFSRCPLTSRRTGEGVSSSENPQVPCIQEKYSPVNVFACWLAGIYSASEICTRFLPQEYCFTGIATAVFALFLFTRFVLAAPAQNKSTYTFFKAVCIFLTSVFYIRYGNYTDNVHIQNLVFKDSFLPNWATWSYHTLLLLSALFADLTYHLKTGISRNSTIYYCSSLMLAVLLITTNIFESFKIDLFMLYPLALVLCLVGIRKNIGIIKIAALALYLAATAGIYSFYYSSFSDAMQLIFTSWIYLSSAVIVWLNRSRFYDPVKPQMTAGLFLQSLTGLLLAYEIAQQYLPEGYHNTILATAVLLQFGFIRYLLNAPGRNIISYWIFKVPTLALISSFYAMYCSFDGNAQLQDSVLKDSILPHWLTWAYHTMLLLLAMFADLRYHLKNSITTNMIIYYCNTLLFTVLLIATSIFESSKINLFTLYPLAASFCYIGCSRNIGTLKIMSLVMYLTATLGIYSFFYADFSDPVQSVFTTCIYLCSAALVWFNRKRIGPEIYPTAMIALAAVFSILLLNLNNCALLAIPVIGHTIAYARTGCQIQGLTSMSLASVLIGSIIAREMPDSITLLPVCVFIPAAVAALVSESSLFIKYIRKQNSVEALLLNIPLLATTGIAATTLTAAVSMILYNHLSNLASPDIFGWLGVTVSILATASVLYKNKKDGSGIPVSFNCLALFIFASAAGLLFAATVHNGKNINSSVEMADCIYMLLLSLAGIPVMRRLTESVKRNEAETGSEAVSADFGYLKINSPYAGCSVSYIASLSLITAGTLNLLLCSHHKVLWFLSLVIFCLYTVPLMFRNSRLLVLKYSYVFIKFYFLLSLLCFEVLNISSVVFSLLAIFSALIFIVTGVLKNIRYLRVAGLWSASAFICKLIVFDINYSNDLYKALSYVGAGVILLIICLIYNNMRKRDSAGAPGETMTDKNEC
jgi:hypothetical protein